MSENRSFLGAVKWAYVGQSGDRAFSAIFTFVLAAMLGPRDFGLVAIGVVYLTFMQIFLDQGLVAALISKADLQPEHCIMFLDEPASQRGFGRIHNRGRRPMGEVQSRPGVGRAPSCDVLKHSPRRALDCAVCNHAPVHGLQELVYSLECVGPDRRGRRYWDGRWRSWAVGPGWAAALPRHMRANFALEAWKLETCPTFFVVAPEGALGLLDERFYRATGDLCRCASGSVVLGALFGPVAVGLYRLADRLMASVIMLASSIRLSRSLNFPGFKTSRGAALQRPVVPAISGAGDSASLDRDGGDQSRTAGGSGIPMDFSLGCLDYPVFSRHNIGVLHFYQPAFASIRKAQTLSCSGMVGAAIDIVCLGLAALLLKTATMNEQVTGIALARFVPTVFVVSPVFIGVLMHFCKIRSGLISLAGSFIASAAIFASIYSFRLSGVAAGAPPFTTLLIEALIAGTIGFAVLLLSDREFRLFARKIGLFVIAAAKFPPPNAQVRVSVLIKRVLWPTGGFC